ncbi:MAG: PKD domain-containing protein [Saprospiraceae bacterium]|nr:PKD domain-containing protein [Saprospiraceae bacterium]
MHLGKIFKICCFIAFFTPSVLEAKHIVGGEITYTVVSKTATSNRYKFTMKIWRDCYTNGGAQLDGIAPIGIYRGSTNTIVESFGVQLTSRTARLPTPTIPCLIPPDVCVEEGIYEWEKELPIINDTYVILYQRCCRNETINNINAPGDVGATYFVEITALGQQTNNNSPTFRQFPPIVICANEMLNFDHSAVDAEGDQLVYEFCQPLGGGGKGGNTGCAGTTPNPPCWPAPNDVAFKSPTYTSAQPLAGDPVVGINSISGRITGIPQTIGQFVVGVCVREYRNGRLLGTLHRDFQFNVAKCDPTVAGKVTADSVWSNNYLIRSCGNPNVSINNLSLDRQFITDFRFDVLIQNQVKTFKEWSPTISFPDTGVYSGNLFLNPGTQCADTINLYFRIFPSVKSDFSYRYDTCVAGPIAFFDKSISPSGEIVKWDWTFGDSAKSALQNPSHLYDTPGTKKITLNVLNEKGCTADTTLTIRWLPVPPLLLIEPTTFNGCTPLKVFFNNISKPVDSTYTIQWDFGDGGKGSAISPTYTYQNPGVFSVNLKVTSPIGCSTSRNFPNWIRVKQGTKADFIYSPEQVSTFKNTVTFTDKSQFASQWQWYFGTTGYSILQNPVFKFRDSGMHKVKLLVSNAVGCTDSLTKIIDVIPQVTYWLPNAFTPNEDGNNDIYRGTGITEGMKSFDLKIFNRWGEQIFQTNDPTEGWNGLKNNKGEPSPQGVYLCLVTYVSPRGEKIELRNYATLIR